MRDIRADIIERLTHLEVRFADAMDSYERQRNELETKHREDIEAIGRERSALEQLIEVENARSAEPITPERPRMAPMMDFLVAKIATHGPIDKESLRSETRAAGYLGEASGRAFHTTLLNIVRGGKIIQLPDGRYLAPTPGASFTSEQEGEMHKLM